MSGDDRRPRTPLHERLYQELRKRIDSDEWPPGHQLPTENFLAVQFQVSRGTIRQAIKRLVDDGLVERTAGRGTFVASDRLIYPVVDLMGFTEQISSSGHTPSSRIVKIDTIPVGDLPADYGFSSNVRRVLSIERVRNADDDPVALEHLLLPSPRFAGMSEIDLESASVYETLETHFGVRIRLGDFTLDVDKLTAGQAALLNEQPGEAAFSMSGKVFDQLGHSVMSVRCYYRRSRYSFQFSMSRKPSHATGYQAPRLVLSHNGE